MMRWLVIGVVALAVLWGGYWFAGSAAVERGAVEAVSKTRERGWGIDYRDLAVAGFPNRFDTRVDDVAVTAPDGAWTWRAPFLQVFALSYRPNHVIVVAPPEQVIETRLGQVDLSSEDLRASVVASPGLALTLRRATMTGDALVVDLEDSTLAIEAGLLAIQATDEPRRYDLAGSLTSIDLPPAWLAAAGLTGKLPPRLVEVQFDGRVLFDADLDRNLRRRPGAEEVVIRDLSLIWGDIDARISGELAGTGGDRPDGTLVVEVTDLDALLATLEGVVEPDQLAFAGRFLAGFAPEDAPDGARVELSVRNGLVLLGPVPLFLFPPLSAE